MQDELRYKTVAVAIIYDDAEQRFLLWHNQRWHGYAFPMKKFELDSSKTAAQAAVDACHEWDIQLPTSRTPGEAIGRVRECMYSEAVRQYTVYDYHLVRVALPPGAGMTLHPDLRFFTFEELLAAPNVTASTKMLATWLVEDREVVVAVLTRMAPRGREFLVTFTPTYQYFFPATRMRRDTRPAEEATQLVQIDLGYDGTVRVVDQDQVDVLQESGRFGRRETRFHFHLCLLDLPDEKLATGGHTLDDSLAAVATSISLRTAGTSMPPYAAWCTAEELRNRPDISPSLEAVLNTVLQLVERNE